ncbi:MAG: RNA-binding protein [Candidatus Marinimicrobia bacterium]|nr:RNA-binding protein [Candidatus Neomarinimicrobiota bacterium]
MRIDKWLWAVRIFKTRSISRTACSKGKIKINGKSVKPSYSITVKTIIDVRKRYINHRYEVIDLIDKRVNAKLVNNYLNDITPKEEIIKNEINFSLSTFRTKNIKGRPTKKDRRQMDKIKSKIENI